MFCGVCGAEFTEDLGFCPRCGRPVQSDAPGSQATATTLQRESAPERPGRENYGVVVFEALAVVSVIIGLAKGMPPLYLGEAAVWGGLAYYWQKRGPATPTGAALVLLLAVTVAGAEGYHLGHEFGSRYRSSLKAKDNTGSMLARERRRD